MKIIAILILFSLSILIKADDLEVARKQHLDSPMNVPNLKAVRQGKTLLLTWDKTDDENCMLPYVYGYTISQDRWIATGNIKCTNLKEVVHPILEDFTHIALVHTDIKGVGYFSQIVSIE